MGNPEMSFHILQCLVRLFAARTTPHDMLLLKLVLEPRAFRSEWLDVVGVECADVRPQIVQHVLCTMARRAELVGRWTYCHLCSARSDCTSKQYGQRDVLVSPMAKGIWGSLEISGSTTCREGISILTDNRPLLRLYSKGWLDMCCLCSPSGFSCEAPMCLLISIR